MLSPESNNTGSRTPLAVGAPALLIGASVALCATAWLIERRTESRQKRSIRSPGVVPTMLKGAFVGSIKTIPQLLLVRLLEKMLRRNRALAG